MGIIGSILEKFSKRRNTVEFWRKRGAVIGKGCEIYPSVNFMEPYLITVGDHVRINEGVNLVTHDGGVWVLRVRSDIENADKIDIFGKISIGSNVHIGTNATVMPGVTIGNNCIIGCGAIVTKDIPDNSVAVGIPARVIETVDEYLEKNRNKFVYTKGMSSEEKRRFLTESEK